MSVWLHYTSTKLEKIKTDFIQQKFFKPTGLWGSYNNEWMEWCTDSGFSTFDTNNYFLYEITLKDDARILTVDSFDKYMRSFEQYFIFDKELDRRWIDWDKVKIDYDGVAFLNYHQIKLDMFKARQLDVLICALDVSCCCLWNHVYDVKLLDHVINLETCQDDN